MHWVPRVHGQAGGLPAGSRPVYTTSSMVGHPAPVQVLRPPLLSAPQPSCGGGDGQPPSVSAGHLLAAAAGTPGQSDAAPAGSGQRPRAIPASPSSDWRWAVSEGQTVYYLQTSPGASESHQQLALAAVSGDTCTICGAGGASINIYHQPTSGYRLPLPEKVWRWCVFLGSPFWAAGSGCLCPPCHTLVGCVEGLQLEARLLQQVAAQLAPPAAGPTHHYRTAMLASGLGAARGLLLNVEALLAGAAGAAEQAWGTDFSGPGSTQPRAQAGRAAPEVSAQLQSIGVNPAYLVVCSSR